MINAKEAKQIVAQMRRETSKPARVRLMQLALKIGRLGEDAKDVYREAIKCEC